MYNAIEYVLNVEIGVLANKPVSVSVSVLRMFLKLLGSVARFHATILRL